MDLYVKNLPLTMDEDGLMELFQSYNPLSTVVVVDKLTRISRGYGFVKMSSSIEGQRAVDEMNGESLEGRLLIVSEAIPLENKRNSDLEPDNVTIENSSFRKTKSEIDEDGWVSVKFDKEETNGEDIPLEVIDKT